MLRGNPSGHNLKFEEEMFWFQAGWLGSKADSSVTAVSKSAGKMWVVFQFLSS